MMFNWHTQIEWKSQNLSVIKKKKKKNEASISRMRILPVSHMPHRILAVPCLILFSQDLLFPWYLQGPIENMKSYIFFSMSSQ